MSKGRLIGEKTPQEVFADVDMIRNAELRLPRIAHLIEILKKEDRLNFSEIPLTIGEARRELLQLVKRKSG
jgi:cobalt/nickel transport system ATP-binding protein